MKYRLYIVNDPRIYVTKDFSQMRIGTVAQASK
jgi:hypothetical protein